MEELRKRIKTRTGIGRSCSVLSCEQDSTRARQFDRDTPSPGLTIEQEGLFHFNIYKKTASKKDGRKKEENELVDADGLIGPMIISLG